MHKHKPTIESLARDVAALAESVHCSHKLLEKIMHTQAELAAELGKVTEQVAKIGTEVSATLAKVVALEAALAAADHVSPEVDAAMAALKAQAQKTDDLIPDVPT